MDAVAPALAQAPARRPPLRLPAGAYSAVLAAPALLFVVAFLLIPAATLFTYSIMTQAQSGAIGLPLTLGHYAHLIGTPLYARVLLVTLRIAAGTSLLAVLVGYPVALVIVRGRPMLGRLTTIILVAPLVVSIVVRTYGWQLVLANGPAGVLNWLLAQIGFGRAAVQVMYSETAVVVGSLHVFLPLLVLPLAASLARIDPSVEEAARTLGATSWSVFRRVTLPLTIPGLVAGVTIVFSLTAASYVTPAILGGNRAQMLGNLLEQQVVAANDWPISAAIAVLMVALTFAISAGLVAVLERRMRYRPGAA